MIPDRTLATLLMTLRTSASATAELKPLDVSEWNDLARWLASQSLAPEDLVATGGERILDDWSHDLIEAHRLRALLDRGPSVAVLLDRWVNSGVWVLGRSDAGYPQRLRQRLGESAPPALFGVGDHRLFRNPGLALVGSRNASDADTTLAGALGRLAAHAGYNVVSGGARGIDTHSEQGAFRADGTVISVLADSLVRTMQKKEYRDHILGESLALITPYSPEAGFSSGNAMGRNRLIYCLADAAIALCSTADKGGTFAGASEAIRRGWVPVWAPSSDDPESGNGLLIRLGAYELPPPGEFTIESLTEVPTGASRAAQQSLFGGR
jgi:predicted Rossmann fold nucleotide-binding protein DprA/Smf involved in DNA uptake